MTLPAWHEEPIQKSHRREEFDCGDEEMNRFIRQYARQSHSHYSAMTFCAIDDTDQERMLGFYTLTPWSTGIGNIPPAMVKGFASHDVGGFKLARIATDIRVSGQGLGGQLLTAAALRCLRASRDVGGHLLYIDAKSERAADWYAKFGAERLEDHRLTLAIPLQRFAGDLMARGFLARSDDDR